MGEIAVKPRAFATPADFRAWLERHHATETELMMRLYKTHARQAGIGYREALDEALCFGWIDGVRRALDADSFVQRFSPRKPKSVWSAVNIARVAELERAGRMAAPGLAAFRARQDGPAPYSFESKPLALVARVPEGAEGEADGVEALRGAPARVQARRPLLGHERQAGGDARAPLPGPAGGVRARRADPAARPPTGGRAEEALTRRSSSG